MLTKELSQYILQKCSECIPYKMVICGDGGVILAANLTDRIGNIHDGARRIFAREINEFVVTREMEEEYVRQGKDTRMGYTTPIIVNGKLIGTAGISGDPEVVKPYIKLVSLTFELIVEQETARERLMEQTKEVDEHITQVFAASQQLSASAEILANSSEQTSGQISEAEAVFKDVSKSLQFIKNLARQTNLISLNAQIESARAGVYGKSFGVVANEVKRLSEQTDENARLIDEQLEHFAKIIISIGKQGRENSSITDEQKEAITGLASRIEKIKQATESMIG